MDLEQMMKNIEQMKADDLKASREYYDKLPDEMDYEPRDIYKERQSVARKESRKRRPNGSATLVKAVTQSIIDGDGAEGLAHAYQRAKNDGELYERRGEKERVSIAKRQYMEEHFLPAVETIIRYSSPDELLNCKEALSALDKYVFSAGRAKGYTAAYIRSAYKDLLGQDLDNRFGESDTVVSDAVRRISLLASQDELRTAVGIAKQIKRQIDDGECMASDEDYSLIGRVAAYGD